MTARAPTRTAPPRLDGTVVLGDGRTLAVAEWGDPAGVPVVLFHGMPGSRWFCPDASVTLEAGVRLVTFDRPGYGGSSSTAAQRTILDVVPDLDALLGHLGIE